MWSCGHPTYAELTAFPAPLPTQLLWASQQIIQASTIVFNLILVQQPMSTFYKGTQKNYVLVTKIFYYGEDDCYSNCVKSER